MKLARLGDWFSSACFKLVHRNNLVYNTCWEDPALDRVALELAPHDTVMVITSAGCNALDYALQGPKHVYAVDMNPRQNALLDLKIAGIKGLDHATFFSLFGDGHVREPAQLYRQKLRGHLPPASRQFWDRAIKFFAGVGWRDSFYFRGTAGTFARMINTYIDRVARVRLDLNAALSATSLEEQRQLYHGRLKERFWRPFLKWAVKRDSTLSLLGVPRPQRLQVEKHYEGGIAKFVEDCLEAVFTELPLKSNYFWRVYLQGHYTPDCCPEYLKPENFAALKAGLVHRVSTHTNTIAGFLQKHQNVQISRYVLLDHMDWLATLKEPILQQEWQTLMDRAAPRTRFLWRSGGLKVDYVDPLQVRVNGATRRVGDLLHYHSDLAARLHPQDRVHTYGSFYIADLRL